MDGGNIAYGVFLLDYKSKIPTYFDPVFLFPSLVK